jgi:hypothetical protein
MKVQRSGKGLRNVLRERNAVTGFACRSLKMFMAFRVSGGPGVEPSVASQSLGKVSLESLWGDGRDRIQWIRGITKGI